MASRPTISLIKVLVSLVWTVLPATSTWITNGHGSEGPHASEPSTGTIEVILTRQNNDKTSPCPGGVKACVALCCPPGVVSRGVSCLGVENSSSLPRSMIEYTDVDVVEEEDTMDGEFYGVENDGCAISWMKSWIVEDFQIFRNGSIRVSNYNGGTVADFGEYCLLLQESEKLYFARMCQPYVRRGYYEICCVIFSAMIMMAIFIVYTIVPELQNLHGLMFRCYVASYIGLYTCAAGIQYTTELKERTGWFTVAEISGRFFGASCALWLNLMSFNIWRSIQYLRPIRCGDHDEKLNRAKFKWYAICVWSCLIFLFGIVALLIHYVPHLQDDIVADALKQWGCVALVTVIYLCNISLYLSTSLTIKRQTAHTSDLIDGMNRHQEVDKQWLSLYLRLSLLMGGHLFVWVIWICWMTSLTTCLLATVEVAQSCFTFVVFVWKDNVKRALLNMFF